MASFFLAGVPQKHPTGVFTDILAGFTFNNRVLRLPAIPPVVKWEIAEKDCV